MKRLYVLQAGVFLKVGIASDIKRRIRELQTGCPYPLRPIREYRLADAERVERILLRRLERFNIGGEWLLGDALTEVEAIVHACGHEGKTIKRSKT